MTTKLLGELVLAGAPICYGILMPGEDVIGGVPVVKVRDYERGDLRPTQLLRTHADIDAQYSRSRLRSGDILLSIRGTTGRVVVVPSELDGANITQDSARIRVAPEDQRYVYHMLQSPAVQRQIALHTVGQAVKGINIASVRKLELPWAPTEVRNAVVRVLDALERAEKILRQVILGKRSFTRATIHELLTFRRRFPEFAEADVEVVRLGDVCNIQIGGTPRRDVAEYWAQDNEQGFPWAAIADLTQRWVCRTAERITSVGVDRSSTKLVPMGTVMMSFKLTIGRVARAACDLYTNEAIAAITPKDESVFAGYLHEVLPLAVRYTSPDTAVKGVTLNKTKLAEISLALPCIEEQRRISNVADLLHGDLERYEQLLSALKAERVGLIQKIIEGGLAHHSMKGSAREPAHA